MPDNFALARSMRSTVFRNVTISAWARAVDQTDQFRVLRHDLRLCQKCTVAAQVPGQKPPRLAQLMFQITAPHAQTVSHKATDFFDLFVQNIGVHPRNLASRLGAGNHPARQLDWAYVKHT